MGCGLLVVDGGAAQTDDTATNCTEIHRGHGATKLLWVRPERLFLPACHTETFARTQSDAENGFCVQISQMVLVANAVPCALWISVQSAAACHRSEWAAQPAASTRVNDRYLSPRIARPVREEPIVIASRA